MPFIGGGTTNIFGSTNSLGSVGDIFNGAGAAVNDLFASDASDLKAQGLGLEATNLDAAAALAGQNEQYTEQSTAIKQTMLDRNIAQTIGSQQTEVAGAGFAASGSALDILRDSASQGALSKNLLAQQGLITEAGYKEQQTAFQNQAQAARLAQQAESESSDASMIGGIIQGGKAALTLASMF